MVRRRRASQRRLRAPPSFPSPSMCSARQSRQRRAAAAAASGAARRRSSACTGMHVARPSTASSSVARFGRVGKERGGVAVAPMPRIATSSGHGSAGQLRRTLRAAASSTVRRGAIERRRSALPPPVLQQRRRAPARHWSAARFRRHEALVDQRHGDLVPVDRLRRKRARRRRPASCRRRRRATPAPLALDGARQRACDVVGQRFGQFAARGEAVPDGVGRGCRHALSCQVRPSRSISAIEADGPQVPAV